MTASRGPHLAGGSGSACCVGGVSGRPTQPPTMPLPLRSSQTRFVRERGLLSRRDLPTQAREWLLVSFFSCFFFLLYRGFGCLCIGVVVVLAMLKIKGKLVQV